MYLSGKATDLETGARTILIVHDESTTGSALSSTLQRHGFKTLTALSGGEAMDIVNGESPVDLVLVDLHLGQSLDGVETAEMILRRRHLPILFISSQAEADLLEKSGQVPSYGYVAWNAGDALLISSIMTAFRLFEAHRECRLAEDTARREHELCLDLVNSAPVGIYRVRISPAATRKEDAWLSSRHAPYSIELVNERFLQILGLTREDYLDNPGILNDLVHPGDRAEFVRVHEQAMAHPAQSRWEGRLVINGEIRRVHFESTPRVLDNGDVVWTGTLQDITERKETEEALRESEANYRGLVESMDDWVWAINNEGVHTYSNNAPAAALGYGDREITGASFSPMMHPEDVRLWSSRLQEHVAQGTGWRKERIRWISKSGEVRYYESTASPVIDASGAIRGFQGIDRDITECLNTEEKLKASHENLAATLQALPDLMFEVDTQGVIYTYLAPSPSRLYAPPEAFLGKSVAEILPEKAAHIIMQAINEAAETGRHQGAVYSLPMPGGEEWFELSIASKGGPGTRDRRFIGLARTITERRRAEEELRESLREKELLLREVHHRVKNNLQIIMSLLSLQARRCENPESRSALKESRDRIKSIAVIHEKIYRSQKLSRIHFGDFVHDITAALLEAEGRGELSLELRCAGEAFSAETAIPLALIVNELVTNALKHAFPGGRRGTITLDCHDTGEGAVVLIVRDDGSGFPEDKDITTMETLGLVLVHALATQIGGTVEMTRERGTVFTVRFKAPPLP
jgi:PAS domain S-box-containing protein